MEKPKQTPEERERILKMKEFYYDKTFVLFEIVKSLKNRELCFLTKPDDPHKKTIRYLIAFSIDYLKKHFKWINFDNSLANMYQSVAKLKDIPVFSYNLSKRLGEEEYKRFNKEYETYVSGYDLFLDFDGKEDFEKCFKEATELKKIFDEMNIPYWLINSSSNGFHFHIPAEYMPNLKLKETLELINQLIYNLKGIYGFTTLDDAVIDMKRVCKVPYSVVNDGTICLPLSDEQFEMFRKENVEILNVLKIVRIKNRGLLLRDHNLSYEGLRSNVKVFTDEFK